MSLLWLHILRISSPFHQFLRGPPPDNPISARTAARYWFPSLLDDLPPPNTKRWVIRRKAEVVAAVRGGLLTLHDACERYTLTVEEFLSWQSALDRHGLAGLRTTRLQDYRDASG